MNLQGSSRYMSCDHRLLSEPPNTSNRSQQGPNLSAISLSSFETHGIRLWQEMAVDDYKQEGNCEDDKALTCAALQRSTSLSIGRILDKYHNQRILPTWLDLRHRSTNQDAFSVDRLCDITWLRFLFTRKTVLYA